MASPGLIEQERANLDIARNVHSLAMLRRIAAALENRVEIRFVARRKLQHA